MTKDDLILIDPEVQHGQPVFKGSRVPIEILFEYIEAGETIGEFREDFPGITMEQIIGLLELSKVRVIA